MINKTAQWGRHRVARRQLARCLRYRSSDDEVCASHATVLLKALTLALQVDRGLRRAVADYIARYRLSTSDGQIDLGITFRDGLVEIRDCPAGYFDASLRFQNPAEMMRYFAPDAYLDPDPQASPDGRVTVEGNLNYAYRLAYLLRRVQLDALGQR
jgi:hypothetical protein